MTYQKPRRTLPAKYEKMTEKKLQTEIIDAAQYYGFHRKYHNLYAVGSDRGFPDLVLVGPTVIYLELKGPRGRVSDNQIQWIVDLQLAGQHAYIVYPRDLPAIEKVFRGDVPPPEPGSGLDLELIDAMDMSGLVENQGRVTERGMW